MLTCTNVSKYSLTDLLLSVFEQMPHLLGLLLRCSVTLWWSHITVITFHNIYIIAVTCLERNIFIWQFRWLFQCVKITRCQGRKSIKVEKWRVTFLFLFTYSLWHTQKKTLLRLNAFMCGFECSFSSAIQTTARELTWSSLSRCVINSFWQRNWYYLFNISKILYS